MGIGVAVIGASGYAGGELLRLIDGHPQLAVAVAVANRQAGRTIGEVHPALTSLSDLSLVSLDDADLSGAELVFLALPHGESAGMVNRLADDVKVVDLGADFRLENADAWRNYYSSEHAGTWTYGLPELPGARARIAASSKVANPGCYATAITLGFAPAIAAGLVALDDEVLTVVAASGTSGAGRGASERLLGSQVMGDLTTYKSGGMHQHIPEIEQSIRAVGGVTRRLSMTPILAPMPRGILAVCSAAAAAGLDTATARAAFAAAYGSEPFLHLLPEGHAPHTSSVLGSNSVQLQTLVEPETRRLVTTVVIDNLGKGAAGQAIQNANLMLGFDETLGLPINGVAP